MWLRCDAIGWPAWLLADAWVVGAEGIRANKGREKYDFDEKKKREKESQELMSCCDEEDTNVAMLKKRWEPGGYLYLHPSLVPRAY